MDLHPTLPSGFSLIPAFFYIFDTYERLPRNENPVLDIYVYAIIYEAPKILSSAGRERFLCVYVFFASKKKHYFLFDNYSILHITYLPFEAKIKN